MKKFLSLLIFGTLLVVVIAQRPDNQHIGDDDDEDHEGEEHDDENEDDDHCHRPTVEVPELEVADTRQSIINLVNAEAETIGMAYEIATQNLEGDGCIDASEVAEKYRNNSLVSFEPFLSGSYSGLASSLSEFLEKTLKRTKKVSCEFEDEIEQGPRDCRKRFAKVNKMLYRNYIEKIECCVNSTSGSSDSVFKQIIVYSAKYASQKITRDFASITVENCSSSSCAESENENSNNPDPLCACQTAVS